MVDILKQKRDSYDKFPHVCRAGTRLSRQKMQAMCAQSPWRFIYSHSTIQIVDLEFYT